MTPTLSVNDPTRLSDLEALMSGYQQADEHAATALIERITPLLFRYFLAHYSNRIYADDLLQDTWMRVHKARHTYRKGEPVLPWILAIARHTRLDNYRRVRRIELRETQVDVLPETPQLNSLQSSSDQNEFNMDTILAVLPASQREVLVMLKVSGMTIEEVARATSSTTGSVKQKAHRAYEKLRSVLVRKVRNS
jgi:RNA polymerase sigma-70 factor (ECF subfamily)